jgi:NAD(P)-dependent dehydrogenase (short-subunit alcohol dehydrogenase family)
MRMMDGKVALVTGGARGVPAENLIRRGMSARMGYDAR